jgi:hypothetical protein
LSVLVSTALWIGSNVTAMPAAASGRELPRPGRTSSLGGIAAKAVDDVWVVGTYGWVANHSQHGFADHWDGSSWTRTRVPRPPGRQSLDAVDVSGPALAWAAGAEERTDGTWGAFVIRWDGAAWTRVPAPTPPSSYLVVSALGSSSANNVWIVGYRVTPHDRYDPLALRWDGTGWRATHPPARSVMTGVYPISARAVVAVGEGEHGGALVFRWNGSRWRASAPGVPGSQALWDVDGAGRRDVWAVGTARDQGVEHGLAIHWDGDTWSRVEVPVPPGGQASPQELSEVAVAGPERGWVNGWCLCRKSEKFITVVARWDGSRWIRTKTLRLGDRPVFGPMTIAGDGVPMALVSFFPKTGGPERSVLLRWDGHEWAHA